MSRTEIGLYIIGLIAILGAENYTLCTRMILGRLNPADALFRLMIEGKKIID